MAYLKSSGLSKVSYPAGHVVQSVNAHSGFTSQNSDSTASASMVLVYQGSAGYAWKGTITDVAAGNYVNVRMSFGSYMYKASNDVCGAGYGLKHSTATDGTGTSDIYSPDAYCYYIHHGALSNSTYVHRALTNIDYIHTSPSAGTNTYYLCHRAYASGISIVQTNSSFTPFICILQEIQT